MAAALATVSHDLKNPLTVIRAQAQVLSRRYAPRLPPEDAHRLTQGLTQIQEETRRMARWIDELSDVARLQLGQELPLERQSVDLVAVVRRVAAEQQRATDSHRVLVSTELTALAGRWDESRLERVLVNLIGNAVKYSPEGGDIAISLVRRLDPPRAVFRVADQGIGIPEDALERIFEPYFRAPNATPAGSGSGLGLFSARRIVERHGGSVAVESREGVGSTFTVCLPLDP
jgi:signal transduction histidine kinase